MKHAFLKLVFFVASHLLAYLCKYVCKDETITKCVSCIVDKLKQELS